LNDFSSGDLSSLRDEGVQILDFFMDPLIHDKHQLGTSCQEVARVLINRVQALDSEKTHFVNSEIIKKLREIIVLFEMRALLNKATDGFEVEAIPILPDGHIAFLDKNSDIFKALDFVHAYIDSSDMSLLENGLQREDILSKARDLQNKVDPVHNRLKRQETLYEDISSYKES